MKSCISTEERAFNEENVHLSLMKGCVLTMKIKQLFHGCRNLFNLYIAGSTNSDACH